ncbi:hypothetical protein CDAR_84641 [Caerostris darwini]|uniref:Uncharacterized protein n=1 Tax=Caerostris darwini TaxID=1538125 RepID=A0AAV4RQ17_9ARAC|nr:hypothetical protein CDAR_84641 [Caerostris darwini]
MRRGIAWSMKSSHTAHSKIDKVLKITLFFEQTIFTFLRHPRLLNFAHISSTQFFMGHKLWRKSSACATTSFIKPTVKETHPPPCTRCQLRAMTGYLRV